MIDDGQSALRERRSCGRFRGRWWTKEGKTAEALAIARRGLVLVRGVHGQVPFRGLALLRWLATLQERQEAWAGAKRTRAETEEVLRRAYGMDHGQVIDARLAQTDCQRQAMGTAVERQQLHQAEESNRRVVRFYQAGKAPSAVALAKQVLAIRKDIFGEKHPDYAQSLRKPTSNRAGVPDGFEDLPRFHLKGCPRPCSTRPCLR
jgi:hypothetical protein